MRFALVNPYWTWEGSTYFGSQQPVVPLELLGAVKGMHAQACAQQQRQRRRHYHWGRAIAL